MMCCMQHSSHLVHPVQVEASRGMVLLTHATSVRTQEAVHEASKMQGAAREPLLHAMRSSILLRWKPLHGFF